MKKKAQVLSNNVYENYWNSIDPHIISKSNKNSFDKSRTTLNTLVFREKSKQFPNNKYKTDRIPMITVQG